MYSIIRSEGFLDNLGLLCIPIKEPKAPVISCNIAPACVLGSGRFSIGFCGLLN